MTLVVGEPYELLELAGADLGAVEPITVDQATIDGFARLTRDEQWIHVDPIRARAGPYGIPIAHGFLTLSLCSYFLERLLEVRDAGMLVNYGLNRVRFPSAVTVGSRVGARGTLESAQRRGAAVETVTRITIEVEDATKASCVAEMVTRFAARVP